MAVTRNPMAGRHAVGGRTANAGKTRAGQGEPRGNRPITGVSPSSPSRSMQPKPGVLANQAETSLDLQRRLTGKAPQPFTNRDGAATLAAPTHPGYRSTGNPKELNYEISNKHSIHNGTKMSADMMAAVGYGPNDTMSTESIISGNPTKGNQRQAGKPGNRNAGTSSRENARMRQTGY